MGKYYFISYHCSKGYGSANVTTTRPVTREYLQNQIADELNVTDVVILYYKRISENSALGGTL